MKGPIKRIILIFSFYRRKSRKCMKKKYRIIFIKFKFYSFVLRNFSKKSIPIILHYHSLNLFSPRLKLSKDLILDNVYYYLYDIYLDSLEKSNNYYISNLEEKMEILIKENGADFI